MIGYIMSYIQVTGGKRNKKKLPTEATIILILLAGDKTVMSLSHGNQVL